ncbi:MAG: alpha/beta hydrolase [Solirubrobacteraceae bacterium]|nr:alpha/beta hydrolase [Solirubrobacteraceae bacterium]
MPATPVTLALIHGLGASRHCWQMMLPMLAAAGLRGAPVELPGYGENRRRRPAKTIEEMADAAAETIDGLGAERVVVVGHSMGGLVATAIAERAASVAERIVIINSSLTVASRVTAHRGSEGLIRKPLIGRIAWRVAPRAKLRNGLRSAFAPNFPVPDLFVDDLKACSWATFTRSSAAMDDYLGRGSLPERLDAIPTPSNLIYGMQDLRIDHDAIASICDRAGGRVTRIEDAGHSPMWETPRVAADAILAAVGATTTRAPAPH